MSWKWLWKFGRFCTYKYRENRKILERKPKELSLFIWEEQGLKEGRIALAPLVKRTIGCVGDWRSFLSESHHIRVFDLSPWAFSALGKAPCLCASLHLITGRCWHWLKPLCVISWHEFWALLKSIMFQLLFPLLFFWLLKSVALSQVWLFSPVNNGSQITLELLHLLLQWLCTLTNLGERRSNMIRRACVFSKDGSIAVVS